MSGRAPNRVSRNSLFCGLFCIVMGFSPLRAQITEYSVPAGSLFNGLSGIAAGPDGAMWFSGNRNIGRITTAGVITVYPLPTSNAGSAAITAGSDGAMWFTESGINGAKIGRITTSGVFTEYPLPDPLSLPTAITAGPDGALWFIESGNTNIGRITTSGVITEFPLPASEKNTGVYAVTAGPDGNLWFTVDYGANKIIRMTTSGVFTIYTVATFVNAGSIAITPGPDGALWFADQAFKIGRITTSGTITEYPLPTNDSPIGIAAGPDGALWFTDNLGQIGRITTSGTLTSQVATPTNTAGGYLGNIAAGPDGAMWFTELGGKIGRIPTGVIVTPPTLTSGSLANGATYIPGGLVPGSWAQVKGSGLSGVTRIWADADFVGLGSNLPTNLSGVQVYVNGLPAALYFIDAGQVSFQVPAGITGTASVQVLYNGVPSNTVSAAAATNSPGIFPLIVNGVNYAAGVFLDYKIVGDPVNGPGYRKARPGDLIQLYVTGLTPVPAGVVPTQQSIGGVTVTIGNVTFPADSTTLVAVGEFQINFTVPQQFATLAEGVYPISIAVNGVSSPAAIDSNPPGPVVLPIQH
jgi:virginiamycin B lyase